MKNCYSCKKEKKLSEFSKDKTRRDGHDNKCKSCSKAYRDSRLSESKTYQESYRKKNSKRIKEYRKLTQPIATRKKREKLQSDPMFKLKAYLRTRVYSILKGTKIRPTKDLLGASYENVKSHIESTFTEGMSWENYGKWHVDHKIPLASAKTQKEVKLLFHYTNLQALWAFDNISKSNRI